MSIPTRHDLEQPPAEVTDFREVARRRVQARRDFVSHLVAYVVINSFLVLAWAVTGGGYFWPVWVLAPWGAGLVLHAWDAYLRRPVTDADIEAELGRRH
jgi:2TM domain